MTIANELLDAGNSPAQLARQAVRYLRNCVIAKITGMTPENTADGAGSELLQISADEQRRAARTAALFTEEELTRFLQVMLRTFDELGYRQEQRFHFELGLLKLVHLRRLLPVEEVLSSLVGAGTRPKAAAAASSPPQPQVAAAARSAAEPARPVFSPFERDSQKRRYDGIAPGQAAVVAAPVVSAPAAPVSPPPVASAPPVASPPRVAPAVAAPTVSAPTPAAPVVPPSLAESQPVPVAEPLPVADPVPVPMPVAVPGRRRLRLRFPARRRNRLRDRPTWRFPPLSSRRRRTATRRPCSGRSSTRLRRPDRGPRPTPWAMLSGRLPGARCESRQSFRGPCCRW